MENKKKYYLFQMNGNTLTIMSLILMFLGFIIIGVFKHFDLLHEGPKDYMIAMLLLVPYFCFHEVLHSISYVIHGADFKNITYGAHLEKGVLCCLCKQNVSKRNILTSLLYPFFFIGICTLIIGLILDSYPLVLLSLLNIAGCSGDLIMFFGLLKIKDYEYSEYDDPTSFGLYTSQNLENHKMFGLKYVGTKDNLVKKDFRKFDINALSAWVLIGLVVLSAICLVI